MFRSTLQGIRVLKHILSPLSLDTGDGLFLPAQFPQRGQPAVELALRRAHGGLQLACRVEDGGQGRIHLVPGLQGLRRHLPAREAGLVHVQRDAAGVDLVEGVQQLAGDGGVEIVLIFAQVRAQGHEVHGIRDSLGDFRYGVGDGPVGCRGQCAEINFGQGQVELFLHGPLEVLHQLFRLHLAVFPFVPVF